MNGIHPVVEYPGTRAGGAFVHDSAEAVLNIPGRQFSSPALFKTGIIGKKNIGPQVKGKPEVIIRYLPAFCQRWFDLHIAVDLHQGIVQLVHRPHYLLVFCKGRVQRSQPAAFIITEYLFIGMPVRIAGKEDTRYAETKYQIEDEGHRIPDAECRLRGL